MENIALIESFSEFKDEKSIDRVTLMAILEEVFRSALKRKFGSDENFDIIINPDKGDLEIWRNRIVVENGEVAIVGVIPAHPGLHGESGIGEGGGGQLDAVPGGAGGGGGAGASLGGSPPIGGGQPDAGGGGAGGGFF